MTAKSKHTAKNTPHILGARKFAAISAVEGLTLNTAGRNRRDQAETRRLSQDERRQEIITAYKRLGG
ncbi:hypothetical protein [Ferrovibrio sp.]|uniref:hypothetical protein n=1 Tax=Ferrovibrio sp. TaxID=1917215 RepID=UPI0025C29AFF|nr:hypothetical protein [Ferrovibrio sp.]MBX3453171.1 hypothetical protein [Ferrovibrio sp.]